MRFILIMDFYYLVLLEESGGFQKNLAGSKEERKELKPVITSLFAGIHLIGLAAAKTIYRLVPSPMTLYAMFR